MHRRLVPLIGPRPRALACRWLQNQLIGTVPAWLGSLSILRLLCAPAPCYSYYTIFLLYYIIIIIKNHCLFILIIIIVQY